MIYGFIGGGRMARAIIEGMLHTQLCTPQEIIVFSRNPQTLNLLVQDTGVRAANNNIMVAQEAEFVILAVKPQDVETALKSCRDALSHKLLVSIVAGKSTASLQTLSGARIVRAMPNTSAMVGASITALAMGSSATPTDLEQCHRVFKAVGSVIETKESLLDAITALSGSGPAYIYLVIEALADGGVAAGLPRPIASNLAIQTVRGAAIMAEKSGLHPAVLREMIMSPGGTTSAALEVLENAGVRAAFIRAVRAAQKRSTELSLD